MKFIFHHRLNKLPKRMPVWQGALILAKTRLPQT
jgi:hypothetical protein